MPIILTAAQAFDLRSWSWYTGDTKRLIEPRLLNDGRYVVPEWLLNDQTFYPKWQTLKSGVIAPVANSDLYPDLRVGVLVDGKPMFVLADRVPWAVSVLGDNHYRFELRQGDQGDIEADPQRLHRCEFVAATVPSKGTELWQAYSVMLEAGNPFTTNGQCYINQWHGFDQNVGYGRAPPLAFDYGYDQFRIWSRSDTAIDPVTKWGVDVLQYQGPSPARGAYTNFVLNLKFDAAGFIRVWMNGTLIVDYTGPVGYYNDAQGTYPQWGIYARQAFDLPATRIANMSWGTTSLASRISSPLPVV